MENEIMFIKLDDIIPNRFQPREVFNEEALNKLADSIRQHGVIEPILVRPVSNKYEIIAGERRYKASVLAGLTKIPAIVKQMDDKESSILAYIENEHRSNVSAIEEARTIDRILKSNNMTQEELAKELGINQSTLANKLRLLSLPMEIQDSLMHSEISERHARSLLSVKDETKQIELLRKVKENKMTVRELDSEIKSMNDNYNDYNQMNELGTGTYNNEAINNNPINDVPNNDNFMSYLNNYDSSNPVSNQQEVNQNNDNFISYLNNYDNNVANEPEANDDNFMNYLNSYDNSNPTSEDPTPVEPQDADFMNYLNSYDNNNPISDSKLNENGLNNLPEDTNPDFMNYLNNYDNNNTVNEPINNNETYSDYNNYLNNYNSSPDNNYLNDTVNNNVVINNVNPPITSNFNSNSYVENNPNYVDISKNVVISDADEIINKLKVVVDDIKATSKYKIDTDEIDYGDMYQITIKIDKRDF